MRSVFTVVLALAVAGCGDSDGGVDFSGGDLGPDLHSVESEDGAVRMGLTREWVYFTLSDSVRARAQAELDADAEAGGVEGFFGGIMRNVVGKALEFRAKYAVAEIRDIRWEDGRMQIVFEDPDRRIDENLQLGEEGEPVTEQFAEDDVRAFAEVFRAVKERGGAGGRSGTAPDGDRPQPTDSVPARDGS